MFIKANAMQEEKELNNGNDHSRVMPSLIQQQQEENTSEIERLATSTSLATEKTASSQKEKKEDNIPEEQEIVKVVEPQQDYQNKYSNQPYQNYQTNNQACRSVSSETNIFGIIGLVAAIFSWISLFFPIIAPLFWLLGLISSSIGMFKKPRVLATAGLVISLAGLIIGIILIALIAFTGRIHAVQNI